MPKEQVLSTLFYLEVVPFLIERLLALKQANLATRNSGHSAQLTRLSPSTPRPARTPHTNLGNQATLYYLQRIAIQAPHGVQLDVGRNDGDGARHDYTLRGAA